MDYQFNGSLINTDSPKSRDDEFMADRNMYLKGRTGYPEGPSESLSRRQRACYMMGYSMSEVESEYIQE